MVKEAIISLLSAVMITLSVIVSQRALKALKIFFQNHQAEAAKKDSETLEVLYSLAISVLDTVSATTVGRIEATQAAAVRKAVKAGEKPFTELTKLSEEAYQDIVAQLSPKIKETLEACVGDTEKLIRNKIEEVLPRIKQEYALATDPGVMLDDIPDTASVSAEGMQNHGEETES